MSTEVISENNIEVKKEQDEKALYGLYHWKNYEKIIFRITFVFLLLMTIPTEPDWYVHTWNYDWSNIHWNMLYDISAAGRIPKFVTIPTESGKWGIASYANLFLSALFATVAGLIWTVIVKARKTERTEYNQLYYWVRVLARYQVGFAIVAWGYRKLVPIQMMWPPTDILNTPILHIQEQKLYWQSVGIVPHYEMFLGFAEFLGGFLLLFRKTTALGAAITTVVLANIVLANHVYDGSVHIHSFMFSFVALILLWKDLPNIWNLLVREKDVTPQVYYPDLSTPWKKYTRLIVKVTALLIFVVLEFVLHLAGEFEYRVPGARGLAGADGYYQVSEFRLNHKILPYDPYDSIRWQDVIVEKWATLVFKVNRKETIDQSNGPALKATGGLVKDIDRGWESSGVQGRHFFYYTIDTVNHVLHLQNKNKSHREEKQVLHYSQPSNTRLIFSGINEFNDSIYVVLDKSSKKYPVILQGRPEGSY